MSDFVRSHRKPVFAKAHLMTEAQRNAYWRMFGQVVDKMEWFNLPASERDKRRYELHERAGLGPISVKAIDHLKGYDAIKAVFLAILAPHDLDAQMRQQYMSCTRLIVRIRSLAPVAYWTKIMHDRFGACDIDELDEAELTQLRNTLEARLAAKAREAFQQAEPSREDREALPDGHCEDGENPF
jgi:hypothetical protein